MSRQRTRAPRRTPLSSTTMSPSPGTRRRSTSMLGVASRKASTGIRLCPPAITVASGSDARRAIASRSVAGAWYSNGAGFIPCLENHGGALTVARALRSRNRCYYRPTPTIRCIAAIMPNQMHLALDVSWTQVDTAWRMPGSWVGRHYPDIALFEDIARIAERGLFDMIFFGDGSGVPNTWEGGIDAAVRRGVAWPRLDMSPWITAMSRVTSRVGFGLTYASTLMHPFYVARLLNSLDHITNGRIGFNVISSQRRSDYQNYGFDELMDHSERYDRMEEFIAVCRALWSSVDADAFVWDRLNGLVADPAKVRPINHAGRFFKVKGPLSVVPSPQGHPVLIQAGGSPRGIWASAGFVDHVFGAGKGIQLMAQQRRDLDAALRKRGRDPEEVGIVWATKVIVGETEA